MALGRLGLGSGLRVDSARLAHVAGDPEAKVIGVAAWAGIGRFEFRVQGTARS